MKINLNLPGRTERKRKREREREKEGGRKKERERESKRDRKREQGQIKHQICKTTIVLTEVKEKRLTIYLGIYQTGKSYNGLL